MTQSPIDPLFNQPSKFEDTSKFDMTNTNPIPTPSIRRNLDTTVAEISPALYAAGAVNGLTREEKNVINNWSQIQKLHRDLMAMPNSEAGVQFSRLDPSWQDALTKYYQTDYSNKPTNGVDLNTPWWKELLGNDKVTPSDLIKSPFRLLMAMGTGYGKMINTVGNAVQNQVINKESFMTASNRKAAFDGKMLYDDKVASDLINKYGNATSYVAMHLLAGQTPGQIIDSWGPNDTEILKAVDLMYNDKKNFQQVVDDFKRAQLSPGRDIARWVNKTFNIDTQKHSGLFNLASGAIDMAYQIFMDPMTYLSFGGTAIIKGAGKAAKIAEMILEHGDVAGYLNKVGVKEYFTAYSENIGKLAEAQKAKDFEKAAEIRHTLETKFSKYASPQEVKVFMESGVKDFDSFVAHFADKNKETVANLLRGLTTDMSWSREGAFQARRGRELVSGFKQTMSNMFKGTPDFSSADKIANEKLLAELQHNGIENTQTHIFSEQDKLIQETTLRGLQRLGKRGRERMSARHPGTQAVYVGEDQVAKSLPVFKAQAYLATGDKVTSEVLTAAFLDASVSERYAILRGIHQMIYRRAGMHGMTNGEEKIKQLLNRSFGNNGSFGTIDKLVAIPGSPAALDWGIKEHAIDGALHNYQIKDGVAAPNWRDVSHFVAKNSLDIKKNGIANSLPNLIGGLFNSKQADTLTSYWAWLTLVPQLGIRTAIDEGFFGLMYLNFGQILDFRNAQRARNVWSAFTGDTRAIGPYKAAMQSLFKAGPTRLVPQAEREAILNKHLDKIGSKYTGYYEAEKKARTELIDKIVNSKYGKRLPEDYKQYIREQALVDPGILRDTSAASLAQSDIATQSIWKTESLGLSDDALKKAIDEAGYHIGRDFVDFDPTKMVNSDVALAMFRNFMVRFNGRGFQTGGDKGMYTADAARIFLKNDALRKTTNWRSAINEMMTRWGMVSDPLTGIWAPAKNKYGDIQKLINSTRHLEKYKDLGYTEGEILTHYANDIFTDLYHSFHGGAVDANGEQRFNQKLLDLFSDFTSKRNPVADHRIVLRNLSFEDYANAVENHLTRDRIFSDIDFSGGSQHLEEIVRTKGMAKTFEWMTRQSDAITRQPLVHLHYFSYRKQTAKIQKEYEEKLYKDMIKHRIESNPSRTLTEEIKQELRIDAQEQSAHFFAEQAMNHAANNVLKYVDNPEVRTIFSYNVRTVGRFYRAVEDFYRRLYRLSSEHGLGTIARMRLMNQGLSANGAVHTDQNGQQYVVLPMDNIIYHAVDSTLRNLTGNDVSINQPIFNNLTMKLTAGNPSFQTDAGVPYLSGPAGALSVLAAKGLLGKFNATKDFSENLDNIALGNMGDNITLSKAVTPRLVDTFWKMLNPDEKNQQEVSALTQAIAYNQANGIGIDPTDKKYLRADGSMDETLLAKDKAEYLKNLRISAHNIVVTRALLGLISPAAINNMDTKDLPEYLKNVGITSMQGSFYDLIAQVKKSYPDVQNPYELALATWIGNNPGKTAYVVSKKNKAVQPVLSYSRQMQSWAIKNSDAVSKYGAGALLFAPNIGQFDPGVWNWASAAGLVDNVDITSYFDRVTMQQHVNAYYDLAQQEADALRSIPFSQMDTRKSIVSSYQDKRRILKLQVPGLETFIASGVDNTDALDFINNAYAYANDTTANIPKDLAKKIINAHDIYQQFMDYANQIDSLQISNASEVKLAEKQRAIAQIENIIQSDNTNVVDQYFKYGLLKLMTAKSRDAAAGINRNK